MGFLDIQLHFAEEKQRADKAGGIAPFLCAVAKAVELSSTVVRDGADETVPESHAALKVGAQRSKMARVLHSSYAHTAIFLLGQTGGVADPTLQSTRHESGAHPGIYADVQNVRREVSKGLREASVVSCTSLMQFSKTTPNRLRLCVEKGNGLILRKKSSYVFVSLGDVNPIGQCRRSTKGHMSHIKNRAFLARATFPARAAGSTSHSRSLFRSGDH